jgi:hypothetical protein
MVSVLASSVVDRGLSPDRVKPKTIKLVFVAQDSVSEWGDMSVNGLLFQ